MTSRDALGAAVLSFGVLCVVVVAALMADVQCRTDTECAAWEEAHQVPEAMRCDGDPCTTPAPRHHNVPASMPDGSIVYLCATMPRPYVLPDGTRQYEEDHYISTTECPAPIR